MQTESNVEKTETQAEKKVYSRPTVTVYGTVERTTLGGAFSGTDGGMTFMMTM